jgi:hypothetical protein
MSDAIQAVLEQLRACGIEPESISGSGQPGFAAMKVVCIPTSLGEGLSALGEAPRDHVVMVRVDSETVGKLDAWVETDAIKSRSQAAALFIREGLRVREKELSELEQALDELGEAKSRLRERAREVLGPDHNGEDGDE